MKYLVFLSCIFFAHLSFGQKTFEMPEGDTTYVMQEYYVVYLIKGEDLLLDSAAKTALQNEHLNHLNKMAEEGYLSMVGPFGDEGDVRGMCIYNTATLQKAIELASADPAVKAGSLKVEAHPWWCAKGSKLN